MRHEVTKMENRKIGLNGLDTSGDSRSRNVSTSPAVGFYIDRANGVPRPKSPRSAYLGKKHSKAIVVALIVFAAAIIIVSGIALAPIGKGKASQPAKTQAPPGAPYPILGYTYDQFGVKLPSCTVTITDLNTSLSTVVVSDAVFAAYIVDLGSFTAWEANNTIMVSAAKDTRVGENQSIVAGSKLWLNTTMGVVIPEFPMVIVPVTGMVALMAIVSLRRRGEEQ